MKKIIVFALCVMTAVSAFAEAYSENKAKQLISQKRYDQALKYAYESEVSKQSNFIQAIRSLNYFLKQKKYVATKSEIENLVNKFKDVVTEAEKQNLLGCGFSGCGLYTDAVAIVNSTKHLGVKQYVQIRLFKDVSKNRNKDLMWQYGKSLLLIDGGLNSPKLNTSIIQTMFRYKPANITKEQQIEFLTKIADMYPIPGTDFTKWKAFMGFVGYKYKALTGKDLF